MMVPSHPWESILSSIYTRIQYNTSLIFLVKQIVFWCMEGQQKQFYCEIYGSYRLHPNGWRRSVNDNVESIDVYGTCDSPHREVPCGDIVYFSIYLNSGNCHDYTFETFVLGTNHMILDFRNPTMNDTGEYVCHITDRTSVTGLQTRSIYLYVVFVEVFGTTLQFNQQEELRCSMKAPTNSSITVRHNSMTITTPFSAEEFSRNCDHQPQISISAQPLEDGSALFSVVIHICNVNSDNIGTYQCEVEYSIPHDFQPQSASIATDVITKISGKGRFGKVMVASAYNIIPHLPTLNKVAVKMALSNTPQSNEIIIAELDVMKQLDCHENICNLLAYCTVGSPLFIIMEYACHGNLKEYLDACREMILQSGQSLFISSTYHDPVKNDSSSSSETLLPGYLSELNVQNFAFQIACGLEHLETVEMVHCDLAARNILISEGFVLKIGDFGMSRKTSDDDNYQHNIIDLDGVVAVKWAPPEALENKGYFFKSDVWSFAVIVWEIASYGSRPFADRKIGMSLNRFIQFLKAGNRLPQPIGLSDSIYQTLLSCWMEEPSVRPSPTALKEFFQDQNC